jgi:hypothetical protein
MTCHFLFFLVLFRFRFMLNGFLLLRGFKLSLNTLVERAADLVDKDQLENQKEDNAERRDQEHGEELLRVVDPAFYLADCVLCVTRLSCETILLRAVEVVHLSHVSPLLSLHVPN